MFIGASIAGRKDPGRFTGRFTGRFAAGPSVNVPIARTRMAAHPAG